MGVDCGCGGTCPMCAPRLRREMFDHAWEIHKVAKRLGIKSTDAIKEEEKEGGKIQNES